MPDRAEMLGVAVDARALSDELVEHVNALFRKTSEPRNDELIATLIGLRARNGLRAVIALEAEAIDDQLGIIGRELTEGVIDLQYLRTPTTRRLGKSRTRFLRTFEKEELFLTSMIIAEESVRGKVLTVAPEEVERAKAIREDLGGSRAYWHCASGTRAVLKEIEDALTQRAADESDPVEKSRIEAERDTLTNVYHFFKLFSLNTHSSPHHKAYFEEGPGGGWPWTIREQYLADEVLAGCVLMAVQITRMWGLAVGHDVTPKASALVLGLH